MRAIAVTKVMSEKEPGWGGVWNGSFCFDLVNAAGREVVLLVYCLVMEFEEKLVLCLTLFLCANKNGCLLR